MRGGDSWEDWAGVPAPAALRPVTPASVARPRLVDQLSRSVAAARITQVVGPAGFGKTTALAQWCGSTALATAWLSLDEDCRNDQRLYSSLLAAHARCAEEHPRPGLRRLRELHVRAQDSRLQRHALVQALGELESDVVLVIDDVHAVMPLRPGSALATLLRTPLPRLRFVLGTRVPLGELAREALAGEAVTVESTDLAFTVPEVVEAGRLLGRELSADVAETVVVATQGWPIGVRLALVSARTGDAGPEQRPAAWTPVPGPGTEHSQLLADYVEHEVLVRLPAALAEFLLDVTTCDEVDVRLAVQLSGKRTAPALLGQAVRQGLFAQRVAVGEDVHYRWHPVFAAACRTVLAARDPGRQAALHRLAARRLADTDPLRAARHALAGADPAQVWSVLSSSWSSLLIAGDAAAVERLCAQLPDRWQHDPLVLLVRGCAADLLGDRLGAQAMLRAAATRIDAAGSRIETSTRSAFAMARLMVEDDPGVLAGSCDDLTALLEAGEITGRSVRNAAQFLLGWTEMRLRRNPSRAVALLESARQAALAAGDSVLAERAATNLAFATAYSGRLRRAGELLDSLGDPSTLHDWVSYDGGIGSFTAGFIDYWRDELVAARRHFGDVLVHGGDANYAALARVFLARIAADSGDPREIALAENQLRDLDRADVHGLPWEVYLGATRATLAAARGELSMALRLCRGLPPTPYIPIITVDVAAIHLQGGDLGAVVRTLTTLAPLDDQPVHVRVSALLLNALVQCRRGQQESAHRLVESAMALAVPEGIARPFRADLPGLRRMLVAQAEAGTDHPEWLAARIAGIDRPPDGSPAARLSPREREVLSYLRGTLTTAEIAEALHVSVNTVKTHQRLIYRKLGVSNRREAVSSTAQEPQP
jgi:LuxR family maltose regulon positive regulatory protein